MKEYAKPTNLEEAEKVIQEIIEDLKKEEDSRINSESKIKELEKKNTENFKMVMSLKGQLKDKEENKEESISVESINY